MGVIKQFTVVGPVIVRGRELVVVTVTQSLGPSQLRPGPELARSRSLTEAPAFQNGKPGKPSSCERLSGKKHKYVAAFHDSKD